MLSTKVHQDPYYVPSADSTTSDEDEDAESEDNYDKAAHDYEDETAHGDEQEQTAHSDAAREEQGAYGEQPPRLGYGILHALHLFRRSVQNLRFQKRLAGERRADSDGAMYTRAEFVAYYGGTAEWDASPSRPQLLKRPSRRRATQ